MTSSFSSQITDYTQRKINFSNSVKSTSSEDIKLYKIIKVQPTSNSVKYVNFYQNFGTTDAQHNNQQINNAKNSFKSLIPDEQLTSKKQMARIQFIYSPRQLKRIQLNDC